MGADAAVASGHKDAGPRTRPGLALAVVMTGVLITAVDTTIVVLALPEIERGLHVALASVIWVIIGYLLVITLLATQVGRLGDMYGRVRMYEAGFLIFILGSALCALSWNEGAIIAFRLLQGVGGALVSANSGAVLADIFPPEQRGRAYGYNGIGWSVGAVLGIVLGGLIVTYISWRWIFWINVPIGIFAVALALFVLHDTGQRQARHVDVLGMVTSGLGLFGVLWAVTRLATSAFDSTIVGFFVGGVALLAVFVLVERAQAEPMITLSLFRMPTMSSSLLASLFQGLANYAVLFLIIMYLQGPRGLSPLNASLLLVPGYVVGGAMGPLAGKLADHLGPVIPATVGLAIQVVALFLYAHLSLTTGLWFVVLASTVNGIGASSFFPANNAAVMKASPRQMFGISSGMLRTFANIGMVFSFSMALLVASHAIPRGLAFAIFVGTTKLHGRYAVAFTTGLHSAFYVSMGFLVLAALLSALRARHGVKAPAWSVAAVRAGAGPGAGAPGGTLAMPVSVPSGGAPASEGQQGLPAVGRAGFTASHNGRGAELAANAARAPHVAAGPAATAARLGAREAGMRTPVATSGPPVPAPASPAVAGLPAGVGAARQPGRGGSRTEEIAGGTAALSAGAGTAPRAEMVAVASQPEDAALKAEAVLIAPAPPGGRIARGVVRGKVADTRGQAIPGALVTLVAPDGRQVARCVANARGAYGWSALDPGLYTLIASAPGYQPVADAVSLIPDAPMTRDLTVAVAGVLAGAVRSARSGMALPDARVSAVDAGGRVVASGVADAEGRYSLRDLVAGAYTLHVTAAHHRPATLTATVPSAGHGVDVALVGAGGLRGMVRAGESGAPLGAMVVTITDSTGRVAAAPLTDREGRFEVADLAEGEYTVVAAGYPPRALSVPVSAGEVRDADLELGEYDAC